MSDVESVKKAIIEAMKDEDNGKGSQIKQTLRQIIKIERECLYGEKSVRGKKQEILKLITIDADRSEDQNNDPT